MLGVMMVYVYDSPSFFDGRCPSLENIALSGLVASSRSSNIELRSHSELHALYVLFSPFSPCLFFVINTLYYLNPIENILKFVETPFRVQDFQAPLL